MVDADGVMIPMCRTCFAGDIITVEALSPYLLSPYLCFISLLYLDLYVLGDEAFIR